jgi:3-isopropylmalate/(R)-2-methylmalate dehydratase small subunit
MKVYGRVWKFDRAITAKDVLASEVDVLHKKVTAQEAIPHLFEEVDPTFGHAFQPGDIVVATGEFGASRYGYVVNAMLVLKASGLGAIVASEPTQTFLKRAINDGFPLVTYSQVIELVDAGDELEMDLRGGTATNVTAGRTVAIPRLPDMVLGILEAGSMEDYVLSHIAGDPLASEVHS